MNYKPLKNINIIIKCIMREGMCLRIESHLNTFYLINYSIVPKMVLNVLKFLFEVLKNVVSTLNS